MQVAGEDPECARDLRSFIRQLRGKGVELSIEDTGLRYRAPKNVLTVEERRTLSDANQEIASILVLESQSLTRESLVASSEVARRAPLSYTQLEHWYDRLRNGGRPVRHIAREFRLHGPLRIELLMECITAVTYRHDALRTRIVLRDGEDPVQEVADKYRPDLEVIPLQSAPESQLKIEIEYQVQRAIFDANDYAGSPLFKAVLLQINTSEYILILALDHMISDLASLHLLSDEVFSAYSQLSVGERIELPPVGLQFPDHAVRLHEKSGETLGRVARRFELLARTRFPRDRRGGVVRGRTEFGASRFEIDGECGGRLRAWARRHGTTVVIATLTAYAALVLRWCDVNETVIAFMTDGRANAELQHTIGFLAFAIYIRVTLERRGTFADLLRVITEEYCRARDDADFGYAISREIRPEFTRNTAVNWLPARGATRRILVPGTELVVSRTHAEFSNMLLQQITEYEQEPVVEFSEGETGVNGEVSYIRNRVSDSDMRRFAANIPLFVEAMLTSPTRSVLEIELR